MRVKESLLKKQEYHFERDLAYEEFINENSNELTNGELDNMEKVFCKSKILKTSKHLHPINNLYFTPLQGA